MTVTYANFIVRFPEFNNTAAFPQTQIEAWIPDGYAMLNAKRLRGELDLAVMLFVAHNIALGARDAAVSRVGGIPGQASGPLASKTVKDVSASYDTGATADPNAGAWNATSYGQRLYRMLRGFSLGGAYVAGPRRSFFP